MHVVAVGAQQSMREWEGHPSVTMLLFLRWPIGVPSWVESFGMHQGGLGELNFVVMPASRAEQRSLWFESGWVLRKIQIPLKKLIL